MANGYIATTTAAAAQGRVWPVSLFFFYLDKSFGFYLRTLSKSTFAFACACARVWSVDST